MRSNRIESNAFMTRGRVDGAVTELTDGTDRHPAHR